MTIIGSTSHVGSTSLLLGTHDTGLSKSTHEPKEETDAGPPPPFTVNCWDSRAFPPTTGHIPAIESHLKELFRSYVFACNARDFDINSPRWATLSPTFSFSSWLANPSNPQDSGILKGINAWLDMLKELERRNPLATVRILEMDVLVAENRQSAQMFVKMETGNLPSGFVRQNVTLIRWACVGGRWICRSKRTVQGMGETEWE